jgi:hypothetical protein
MLPFYFLGPLRFGGCEWQAYIRLHKQLFNYYVVSYAVFKSYELMGVKKKIPVKAK